MNNKKDMYLMFWGSVVLLSIILYFIVPIIGKFIVYNFIDNKAPDIKEKEELIVIPSFTGNDDIVIQKSLEMGALCNVSELGDYKEIDIFTRERYSPTDYSAFKTYTNLFKVSGSFEQAYACVVSDVVDYRKNDVYHYSTYLIFHEKEMAGHVNVNYSTRNRVVYNDGDLDGRFRGSETPKIYGIDKLDLSNLTVADFDGGHKTIKPIRRFNEGGYMHIGGFVNAENNEGIIRKFKIIYKGEDASIEHFK